jgi:hypothetical protein
MDPITGWGSRRYRSSVGVADEQLRQERMLAFAVLRQHQPEQALYERRAEEAKRLLPTQAVREAATQNITLASERQATAQRNASALQ